MDTRSAQANRPKRLPFATGLPTVDRTFRWRVLLAGAVAAAVSSSAAGASDESDCWRLVAASDLVVQGRVQLTDEVLRSPPGDPYTYLAVPFKVERPLKGQAVSGADLVIRYARQPSPPQPDWADLKLSDDVVAFLAYVDSPGTPGLYFSRSSQSACAALLPYSAEREVAIRGAVAVEEQIASVATRNRRRRMSKQVLDLTRRLTSCQTQDATYEALLALGQAGVADLVAAMDDRRALCRRHAAVRGPGFEGVAVYGPEVVTDLIDIVLSSLTNESFGSLANGSSERVRSRVVAAWRVYLERRDQGTGGGDPGAGPERGSHEIDWNPRPGVETEEGLGLSPATALAHDADHALQLLKNREKFNSDATTPAGAYDSSEEQMVIAQGAETAVARVKGETARTSHAGNLVPVGGVTEPPGPRQ
jgi:hypothetical protein